MVESYFGMRSIAFAGGKLLLNGKPVFQRLVLDQGFYPDGIYTAPSDAALEGDIRLSMDMGFNGARLHEKIFEERFLYQMCIRDSGVPVQGYVAIVSNGARLYAFHFRCEASRYNYRCV